MKISYPILLLLFIPVSIYAQQRTDTTFTAEIDIPMYQEGEGPNICIDSAHNNFHTMKGGFAPFAKVVREDGYIVTDLNSSVTGPGVFDGCKIYMVVNPLHESNIDRWELPNPSAFSEDEIAEINRWVRNGGSLFLVADHMPFAGAAKDLAASFGFQFRNGFAMLVKEPNQLDIFSVGNGRLLKSPVSGHEIISLTSYTGSAFRYPEQAVPVMVFKEGDFSFEPEIAWQFKEDTKRVELAGHAQGALMGYGAGKLAIFGEAAMFTAQTVKTEQGILKIGLNNQESAPQNLSFLLNVVHWLEE